MPDVIAFRDVAGDRDRGLSNLFSDGPRALRVEVDDGDARALAGETARDLVAET